MALSFIFGWTKGARWPSGISVWAQARCGWTARPRASRRRGPIRVAAEVCRRKTRLGFQQESNPIRTCPPGMQKWQTGTKTTPAGLKVFFAISVPMSSPNRRRNGNDRRARPCVPGRVSVVGWRRGGVSRRRGTVPLHLEPWGKSSRGRGKGTVEWDALPELFLGAHTKPHGVEAKLATLNMHRGTPRAAGRVWHRRVVTEE